LPNDADAVLEAIAARPSLLMVGTIEPRKGYLQALEAFSCLWQEGVDVALVIVGREGWDMVPDAQRRNIPETVRRLRQHPEQGRRLIWLDDASDEYLARIYAASSCLLCASEGEGFGLPLIEGAQHGLPILCRDLPVFREVAGENAQFFSGDSPEALAAAISDWLARVGGVAGTRKAVVRTNTWAEAAATVAALLYDPKHPRWLVPAVREGQLK
jgi:glycosyltransferase involved in cell wall biosynthesis